MPIVLVYIIRSSSHNYTTKGCAKQLPIRSIQVRDLNWCSHFSCSIFKDPEFRVVFPNTEQVKQLLIVKLQEGNTNRELLDVLRLKLLKELVEGTRYDTSLGVLSVRQRDNTSSITVILMYAKIAN